MRWALIAIGAVVAVGVSPTAARASNHPPTCEGRTLSVAPGGSRALPLTCEDGDEHPERLTYEITDGPDHGTLGPVGHRWIATARYTPDPGFDGTDTITFRATDGEATTAPVTHQIVVTDDNQPPSCSAAPRTAPAGELTFAPCTDPDEGDAVEVELTDPPQRPAHTEGPRVVYRSGGFVGADELVVEATDGTLTSAPVTIPLTAAADRGVMACDDRGTIPVRTGREKRLGLHCQDDFPAWGSWQSFLIEDEPAHGTIRGSLSGQWVYVPDVGYTGPDTATVVPHNGWPGAPIELDFLVGPDANEPPVCHTLPPVGVRAGRSTSSIWCVDPDDDPLTFQVLDPPDRGSYTAPATTSDYGRYTAAAGQSGDDELTVRASDGRATSTGVTQRVRVIPAAENHAPVCRGSVMDWPADLDLPLAPDCLDEEDDPVTYAFSNPAHGDIGFRDDGWPQYEPDAGFTGTDAFTYTGADGTATSTPTPMRVNVFARTPPECTTPPVLNVRSDRSVSLVASCRSDLEWPSWSVVSGPSHGTVGGGGTQYVSYRSAAGYDGADSVTVRATNAQGHDEVTIAIDVDPDHNTVPICGERAPAVTREQPVDVTLECVDMEADPLTYRVDSQPAHGTLGPVDGDQVRYTPDAGYVGNDSFTFHASDGRDDSETVTRRVIVRDADRNAPPFCSGSEHTIDVDATAPVEMTCTDPDDEDVTIAITADPKFGTVSGGGDDLIYTPKPGFEGTDTLTFVGTDERGGASVPAIVVFHVGADLGLPSCLDVAFGAVSGVARTAALTCTLWWTGGPPLEYELVDAPAHGSATVDAATGAVTYTADATFTGVDTFTYRARSGTQASAPATATVTVSAPPAETPNDPPSGPGPAPTPAPPPPDGGTGASLTPLVHPDPGRKRIAPARLARGALGGPVVRVKRIGALDVFRRTGKLRVRGRKPVKALALVCARPRCSTSVRPSIGRRTLLTVSDTRAGVLTLDPRRAGKRRRATFAFTVGRARGTVTLALRR